MPLPQPRTARYLTSGLPWSDDSTTPASPSAIGLSPLPTITSLLGVSLLVKSEFRLRERFDEQGVEGPLERRRRAIRRGGGLLDRLDELKLALLSGEPDEGVMDRLGRVMREERPQIDDPGLSALMDQIDLRAAVEMAKAELRRSER